LIQRLQSYRKSYTDKIRIRIHYITTIHSAVIFRNLVNGILYIYTALKKTLVQLRDKLNGAVQKSILLMTIILFSMMSFNHFSSNLE